MAIIVGNQEQRNKLENINQKLLKIKGEISRKEATFALAEFLRFNIKAAVLWLTGVSLGPHQIMILRAWFQKNYALNVWGRGTSKTICFSDNQKVITPTDGLIGIKTLLNDYLDFSKGEYWAEIPDKLLWNGNSWQFTNRVLVQPDKEVWKIRTKLGYEIEAAPTHKLKFLNKKTCKIEWHRLGEIDFENYIPCISRSEFRWGVGNVEQDDLEEAYFVGLLVGDGCYSPNNISITLTTGDEEIMRLACEKYCAVPNTKMGTLALSLRFPKVLMDYILDKYEIKRSLSYDKNIPQLILKNKLLLREFLSGFFDADGSVPKRGDVVECCTCSLTLAKQIHDSLLTFGIISRLVEQKTKSKFGKAYKIIISGNNAKLFIDRVGFKLDRKTKNFVYERIYNTNNNLIYGALEFGKKIVKNLKLSSKQFRFWHDKVEKRDQKNLSYKSFREYLQFFKKVGVSKPLYKNLIEIEKENYFFDPIVDKKVVIGDCIDFNIPMGEQYWCNGFINHNSFLIMIFIFLFCVFNGNKKVVIVSSNFRNSRRILEEMEKLAKSPSGKLLMACFKVSKLKRGNDQYSWEFNNGSEVKCVPLSGGDGLRGLRADVLIVDEALLVPKTIIDSVLIPFLVSSAESGKKIKVAQREKRLIKAGKMKEEDKTVFASNAKLILLSSASYKFEDFYKIYKEYLENIERPMDREGKKLLLSYFVAQLSYEAIPADSGFLDMGVIQDALKNAPQSVIDREYKAKFTDGSDGYFSPKKMAMCTIPNGEAPHVELVGDATSEYVLGIDPSSTSSDAGDHFAMSLLKLGRNASGNPIGTLVHSYALAGADLSQHIAYFKYLLTNFNIVYIACDTTQGDNFDFINACNESSIFKEARLDLKGIDAPFGKGDYEETIRCIRKDYNREVGRIVQKQTFSGTSFLRSANEYLQASFDYKWCMFASKAAVDGSIFNRLVNTNIGNILEVHKKLGEFGVDKEKMTPTEFIEWQDSLIDLTKTECAYIEVKSNLQGTQSFDLPSELKRSTNVNRVRKDNYSSLLLANWGLKCYMDAMSLEIQPIQSGFTPFVVKTF